MCSPQQRAAIILANKDDKFGGEKSARERLRREGRAAVPLRVGLVVFVSLVFDHPEAADADVWSGHLHPVQSDPAEGKRREEGEGFSAWEHIRNNKYVVVSMSCALLCRRLISSFCSSAAGGDCIFHPGNNNTSKRLRR